MYSNSYVSVPISVYKNSSETVLAAKGMGIGRYRYRWPNIYPRVTRAVGGKKKVQENFEEIT